jgi:mRNA interferase MazF
LFEVLLPEESKVAGAILADQLKTLDRSAKEAEYICTVPESVLKEVQKKAVTLIL